MTFGLGLVATTVLEAANLLLQRDYPSIVNFGNEKSNSFGTIMVPQIALPGVPKIFDVDQTRDAIEKLNEAGDKKTANKLKGDIARQQGDLCEMNLVEALKQHYEGRNVIVINGLKMLKLDGKPGQDEQEIDIIIVDYDLQILWNIESKKKLDFVRMKNSSAWKAKLQLQKGKEVIQDWFDTELDGDWKFGSALYTEDPSNEINNCDFCSIFIGFGARDLIAKLQVIEENLKLVIPSTKHKEDLLNLAKFMLYCCPKSPLPTTGNLSLKIKQAIDLQGSAENILVHFFPTQQQLSIEDYDKMAICGCWGCGKSGILTHEAVRLARKRNQSRFGSFWVIFDRF